MADHRRGVHGDGCPRRRPGLRAPPRDGEPPCGRGLRQGPLLGVLGQAPAGCGPGAGGHHGPDPLRGEMHGRLPPLLEALRGPRDRGRRDVRHHTPQGRRRDPRLRRRGHGVRIVRHRVQVHVRPQARIVVGAVLGCEDAPGREVGAGQHLRMQERGCAGYI